MTPEQIAKLQADMAGINGGISKLDERFTAYDLRIKNLEESFKNRVSIPGVENGDGKVKFSFGKAMYGILTQDWTQAGFEKSVFDEARRKAMSTNTGSVGGYLVPVELQAELIPLLRAKTIVRELGATILDNLSGSPVTINKVTGGAIVYDVGQNQTITPSQLAFGQINLTPKTMAALVPMSRQLSVLANPSMEGLVRDDISQAMALGLDYRALRGKGTDGQAMGIVNTPGIGTLPLGGAGAVPGFDDLKNLMLKIQMANADVGDLAFAMNPTIKNVFDKLKDKNDQYLLQPDISAPGKMTLCGYRLGLTTQLPINLEKGGSVNCSEIIFGNWKNLILAMWGGMVLEASTDAEFAKHQLLIKVVQDYDVGLRYPEGLAIIPDARVSA